MKKHRIVVLVLSLSALPAQAASDLTFKDVKVGTPTLSLSESLKQPPLFFSSPGRDPFPAWFRSDHLRSAATKRFTSRMPIVTPSGDVDKNMPIKAPDPSIDYKMIVKTPDVESVK